MTQQHQKWPPDLDYRRGFTACSPTTIHSGQAVQRIINHLINWRFNGLHFACNWRPNSATNDATGKYYPIFHYPPTLDDSDRKIAIGYSLWGNPANGAWSLQFEDSVAGYAQEDVKAGSDLLVPMLETEWPIHRGVYPTRYKPPSGGAANLHRGNFKACEMETTNLYVASLTIWHIEAAADLADALMPVALDDVAAGRIISENANSLQGLYELIGDGSDAVTAVERMGRGIFFNESHPEGVLIAAGSAWTDFTGGNKEFPARCRQFADCDSERYCYPALVIETTGVDATHTAQIKFSSDTVANPDWIYTVQNAEPDGTPYLITPAMAGSSDANGLRVKSAADDSIRVLAQTDSGVTVKIKSWMLAEGPAWS